MIAGMLYMLGDIIGGIITPNYDFIENAVSELIQSGAENRVLLSAFLFFHALMIIMFAIGVIIHHPYKKSKSIYSGGILLLLVGICHAFSSSIFPMDPVGAEATIQGMMHLVLVGVTVIAIFFLMPLLGIGLYRLYRWKSFRSFTFVCLAVILISGTSSPIVIANDIQIMGLTERITGYTFYLWLIILAYNFIKLLPGEFNVRTHAH
jgi:hypothetical protein